MEVFVWGAVAVSGWCFSLYFQRKYYLYKIFHLKKNGIVRRRTRKRREFGLSSNDLDVNVVLQQAEDLIKWNKKG